MIKTLIMMMGLPRSGKSTIAALIRDELPNSAIVEPDAVRLAMHGERYIESAEPYVWATSYVMVEALFRAGTETVIIDSTSMSEGARKSWLKRFGHLDDVVIDVVHVETPREVCIDRAYETLQDDLVPVINRMADGYEPLNEVERALVRQYRPIPYDEEATQKEFDW